MSGSDKDQARHCIGVSFDNTNENEQMDKKKEREDNDYLSRDLEALDFSNIRKKDLAYDCVDSPQHLSNVNKGETESWQAGYNANDEDGEEKQVFVPKLETHQGFVPSANIAHTDVTQLYPSFRPNKVLRYSKLFGSGKSSSSPQIWRNVRKNGSKRQQIQNCIRDCDLDSGSDKENGKNKFLGWRMNYGPDPTPDQLAEDDEEKLLRPAQEKDEEKYPGQMNEAHVDPKGFSPEKSDVDDEAYLMVSQLHWEDRVVWDGLEIRNEISRREQEAAGWIPSAEHRTVSSFMHKNYDPSYSMFPVENTHLIEHDWEDDIIWDSELVKEVPEEEKITKIECKRPPPLRKSTDQKCFNISNDRYYADKIEKKSSNENGSSSEANVLRSRVDNSVLNIWRAARGDKLKTTIKMNSSSCNIENLMSIYNEIVSKLTDSYKDAGELLKDLDSLLDTCISNGEIKLYDLLKEFICDVKKKM